jgi:membrane protease YdiL (CAAX protease family)
LDELTSTLHGQFILVTFVISVAIWVRTFRKSNSFLDAAQRLCPARDRVRPFWTPLDSFFLYFAYPMFFAMTYLAMGQVDLIALPKVDGGFLEFQVPSDPVGKSVAAIVSGAIATITILGFLRIRSRDALSASGWRWFASDIGRGLLWSLLLLPPVLILSFLISHFVKQYEHDVLNELKWVQGPAAVGIVLLATGIVAPLVEEFLFRGLMQGMMEYIDSFRRKSPEPQSDPRAEKAVAGSDRKPYRSSESWRPWGVWPVVASSFLFAMAHVGQGAAPIPLFFLALGLGWLYRQTGSLVAPFVVHCVLNLMTLGVTLLN